MRVDGTADGLLADRPPGGLHEDDLRGVELLQDPTDLRIHVLELVVVLRPVAAHVGVIRVIRGHAYAGRIVHPQDWPDDIDYAGQQVVVIGSGATAVTTPSTCTTCPSGTSRRLTASMVVGQPASAPSAGPAGVVETRQVPWQHAGLIRG